MSRHERSILRYMAWVAAAAALTISILVCIAVVIVKYLLGTLPWRAVAYTISLERIWSIIS